MSQNDHLILISGESASGKSASLKDILNPEGVYYLNCECNKRLPFKSKFQEYSIVDPEHIKTAFTSAEQDPKIHTIIIDTLTYMMDLYETTYVQSAEDTRSAWGNYAKFFLDLMSSYVGPSTKNVIFLAHTADIYDDKELVIKRVVKVKGSIMNKGVEAAFATIVSTKCMALEDLEPYKNDLLIITEEEQDQGFKYVYQTKVTKGGAQERIRGPIGMWPKQETFIDNNIQFVINRLHEYYN